MNTSTMELNINEMEHASGGTFDDNLYLDSEYASVGISIVSHWIVPNEFWWKGQDIGHDKANQVVMFSRKNGRQPSSFDELLDFGKAEANTNHGCDLMHLAVVK